MAELIAFNKNEKLESEGFCKLTINACSNLLLIEPKNEDYKMISSLFTWKYIAEKNILFVFGEHFFHDFALIFSNENKCKKVFNILIEKNANIGTSELIHKRFLPKLFEVISIRADPKLKKILANWINKCENGEKEKHIQLLKNYEIYDLVFPKQRSNNRNVKVESDIEEIPVNLDTLSENNLDGEYFNEENNRYIYFKYGFIAREQKILNKIANFTDQEIRNLGNSVQCPYCHQLYNGPYANYYRHLIKNKCAKTDDDCPERLLQQLNSYALKHIYSNCYIHDDELNLMINGLSERSISIFLDALIVGGKVFNISNEQIHHYLFADIFHK